MNRTKLLPGFENPRPRRSHRKLMHVVDADYDGCTIDGGEHRVRFGCHWCGHETNWVVVRNVTEGRRGRPCPVCNEGDQ